MLRFGISSEQMYIKVLTYIKVGQKNKIKKNFDVFEMKKNFADSMNNQDAINPMLCLEIKEHNIDGKIILHVFVPESSQAHRFGNKIF